MDFPAPVPPIIPTVSPSYTERFRPSREFSPEPLYLKLILLKETRGILPDSFTLPASSVLPTPSATYVIEDSSPSIAATLCPQAIAFVVVTIRFASFISSIRICDM